jgi:hypothetical protein
MSGLWNQPGLPHKGWRCVGVEDLRDDEDGDYEPATCQMCGNESLRFVHSMEHDDYEGQVDAGCVCAEKMCEGYDGKAKEQGLINRAKRKANWLKRKWRRSQKGNPFLTIEGRKVGIHPDRFKPGKWGWWIEGDFSRKRYDNDDLAKLALFEELADRLGW